MSSYNQDPYRPVGEQPVPPTTGGVPSNDPYVVPTPVQPDGTGDRARAAADSVAGPAADVKDTAAAAGKDVLDTAKTEAGQVVEEAKFQGRRLLDESVNELRGQASTVQAKLADTLQALTEELGAMAASPDANGPMAQLAGNGRELGDRAVSWLRSNDLDQALYGVRRYAARNPWTFLAVAGGAGLLVGRLARGLRDGGEADRQVGQYRAQGLGTYPDTYTYTPGASGSVQGGVGYPTGTSAYGDADPDPLLGGGPTVRDPDLYRDSDTRGNA